MVTQQEVAERAGVGRRTVSHVITGFPHVSADARERVLRAIDELGYVPNRAAQQLRTGRSGVIALTVPEIGVGYFGELGTLIVEVWPQVSVADAQLLAESLARLAISHTLLPTGDVTATAEEVIRLVGPFVDEVLGS